MTVPSTLWELLHERAARAPAREYLVVGARDEVWTYQRLADASERFAAVLWDLGVRPGDRVAISMANSGAWVAAAFGAMRLGAVAVALSTRLVAREATAALELTRPRVWVTDHRVRRRELLRDWLPATRTAMGTETPCVVVRGGPASQHDAGLLDWDTALLAADPRRIAPAAELRAGDGDPELDGVAVLIFTSGTTSDAKAVMLRHDALLRAGQTVGRRQELTPSDVFASAAPFFHCSGLMHGLVTTMVADCKLCTTAEPTAAQLEAIFLRERPTVYHGMPLPLEQLIEHTASDSVFATLDRVWIGGSPPTRRRLEQATSASVSSLYGLTEVAGCACISVASEPEDARHLGDGRPLDDVELRIADPATGAAPPDGSPGEILLRGWIVTPGYFRDPAATAQAIDADGWLHTGDLATVRDDGNLCFSSRLKDMIKVGGENVAALEVENVLEDYPGIHDVAVIGRPDERLDEVPVAFIVADPGAAPTVEELEAHCSRELASFKVPRAFIFIAELPRSDGAPKVQKYKLRELVA